MFLRVMKERGQQLVGRSTDFTFGIPWIMGFFHQDWTLEATTEAEAVARQFVAELEPESVLLVRRDALMLLDGLSSEQMKVLWEGCSWDGEYFFRRGVTDGAQWMRQVIDVCNAWLARRTDTPVLSGADRYEGRELIGEVLPLIAEFSGDNGDDVTAALTECARRCTPDLAFRLLLRALTSKSSASPGGYVRLSRDQYARLEAMGVAFQYGEYVITDVEYLVAPD
ncbi:hypothetical protein DF268_45790 [Streptomyces sp. V2]|nr:hypothetical protein [Streptomyces sp. V2]PWG06986.1 hypothetical protein DF268_45790 [Streptomyces sp. V2]